MFFLRDWKLLTAAILTCVSMFLVMGATSVTGQGLNPTGSSNTVTLYPLTDPANSTFGDCPVILANNQTYAAVKTLFKGVSGNGRRAVYITLKVGDYGRERLFDLSGNDTFAPDQWVWATPKGKNLLRMPLDYVILSLGILTMGTANFNISLHESTVDCLKSRNVPYERTVHVVTKFLAENVTGNGTTVEKDSDFPVICRSAYAFTHAIFVDRGIGYKCCSSPESEGDAYRCETPYTISWEMVWYGPVVLLCWVYAIFLVHFYKLYRRSFNLKKMRELSGLRKTLNEIKSDMANRIVRMSEDIARIRTPDDLIAMRERAGFLDVLGVDKSRQSRITAVSRVLFTLLMFSAYYVACGVFLYEYRLQLGSAFQHLRDSGAVYLNILGHLGWVFCDMSIGLSRYAVFELVCTLLMPFFALIVYFAINYRQETIDFAASKKRAEAAQEPQRTILHPVNIQKLFMPAVTGIKRLFLRFLISRYGKVVQVISFALFFLYVVLVAGVFVTYVVYFVGLGVFANIDVISPYIIPMVVCFTFFTHSFSPAYYQYRVIKDTIFSICLERNSRLIIKKHKEIFLKREIVDNFYVPNSRSTIYNCVLRILVVIAFMLLVILVILTLQYPYYFQMDSIVSFLGLQVVFFLPLLSGLVNNNDQFSALEESILQRDLKAYIEQYEEDHPAAPAIVAEEANGTTPGGSDDSAMENEDDGMYELGELGFGNPVADPVMKSASDAVINIRNNRPK